MLLPLNLDSQPLQLLAELFDLSVPRLGLISQPIGEHPSLPGQLAPSSLLGSLEATQSLMERRRLLEPGSCRFPVAFGSVGHRPDGSLAAMSEGRDLERFRDLAGRAAEAAGRVILEAPPPRPELKGRADYVTEVDRRAEETIRDLLGRETPEIPVVGEEFGGRATSEYWLVDPLDGTVNFLHRFPAVGVSVALVAGGSPVAGAVHAPYLNNTWTAARGRGSEQDGRSIRVSEASPENAIVGTG